MKVTRVFKGYEIFKETKGVIDSSIKNLEIGENLVGYTSKKEAVSKRERFINYEEWGEKDFHKEPKKLRLTITYELED